MLAKVGQREDPFWEIPPYKSGWYYPLAPIYSSKANGKANIIRPEKIIPRVYSALMPFPGLVYPFLPHFKGSQLR